MQKIKHILLILTILLCTKMVAVAMPELNNNEQSNKAKVENYIKYVYDHISFRKIQKLNYEAFNKAYYGYLNLREAGKINSRALLTVCDFSISSNIKRMWVIDITNKKVLFNSLVAHGMGSGEEFATKFSNVQDSHQSSLGFYTTAETYMGTNGYSLKLHGVDGAYNSNAFDRDIVVHGADYVNASYANSNNRIGRSHGCPALPRELATPIINKIQEGNCLFIYYPNKDYLRHSYWLTNSVSHLPDEAEKINMLLASKKTTNLLAENTSLVNNCTNYFIDNFASSSTKTIQSPSPSSRIIEAKTTTIVADTIATPKSIEIPKRMVISASGSY